jgi:hypothetical protein
MPAKRSAATLAVAAVLALAGPAGAILYNGHAGLGSNAAVHDGTSNTLMIASVVLMADNGGQ